MTRFNGPENQPPVGYVPNVMPEPIYPKKRRIWPWILAGLAALVAIACAFGALAIGSAANQAGKAIDLTTTAPSTPHPAAKVGASKPVGIGAGTWEVGRDVKAGKYRSEGAADSSIPMCYWDVRKGSETGDFADQGVVTDPAAQGRVTLRNGEFFKTSGCKNWTLVQ